MYVSYTLIGPLSIGRRGRGQQKKPFPRRETAKKQMDSGKTEGFSTKNGSVVEKSQSSAQPRARSTALCQPARRRVRSVSDISGSYSRSRVHWLRMSSRSRHTPVASPAR